MVDDVALPVEFAFDGSTLSLLPDERPCHPCHASAAEMMAQDERLVWTPAGSSGGARRRLSARPHHSSGNVNGDLAQGREGASRYELDEPLASAVY